MRSHRIPEATLQHVNGIVVDRTPTQSSELAKVGKIRWGQLPHAKTMTEMAVEVGSNVTDDLVTA